MTPRSPIDSAAARPVAKPAGRRRRGQVTRRKRAAPQGVGEAAVDGGGTSQARAAGCVARRAAPSRSTAAVTDALSAKGLAMGFSTMKRPVLITKGEAAEPQQADQRPAGRPRPSGALMRPARPKPSARASAAEGDGEVSPAAVQTCAGSVARPGRPRTRTAAERQAEQQQEARDGALSIRQTGPGRVPQRRTGAPEPGGEAHVCGEAQRRPAAVVQSANCSRPSSAARPRSKSKRIA